MKKGLNILSVLTISLLMSCGGGEKKEKESPYGNSAPAEQTEKAAETTTESGTPASKKVDLTNKGIGPIKSVTLAPEIDQTMATHGKEIYDKMCMACHRIDKKFVGPAPTGILDRRTPEWVMNMILNPNEMVEKDPLAKELLVEFNGSPMANQNLSEADARAVLEYFRTLK